MDPESANNIMNMLPSLLPILALVLVFYFFIARPQKKKEKANREMLENIKIGDNITTIGGIFGTVSAIRDEVLTIDVGAEKTKLMIARWAIRNVEKPLSAD